jgi:hypothetical protein
MWFLLQVLHFLEKRFIVPRTLGRASRRIILDFIFFQLQHLWAFSPFFPWNEVQSLLGVNEPENPKDEETKGKKWWKVVSMDGNGMMTLQGTTQ